MNKLMYRLGALLSTGALVAATLTPVTFGDNTAVNDTTGPLSTNTTSITNTNSVTVSNVSDAHVSNMVKTVSDTGGNSASYNTLGGTVQTGNAASTATLATTANVNTTIVAMGQQGADNLAANDTTGPLSDNNATIGNVNSVAVFNDNTAWLTNRVDAESRTGDNSASYNTGPGMIQSGMATTNVGILNRANDSATSVTGLGGSGDNLATNTLTGPLSTNNVGILNANGVMVSNVSDAAVMNSVFARARTGGNSASYNTMGGGIQSGNAGVGVGLDTTANYNTTTVAMAMGGFTNEAGTVLSGPLSDNSSTLTNANSFQVFNWNNKGRSTDAPDYCKPGIHTLGGGLSPEMIRHCWGVFNYDFDSAFTGGNSGSYNTLPGGVMSGMSTVLKTIRVWLNDSWTAIN